MFHGYRVFTSNVDGHFQRPGFADNTTMECHGSSHHLQCTRDCGQPIWPADDFAPVVDLNLYQLTSELPVCPNCLALARPNILMFNDDDWDDSRTRARHASQARWLAEATRTVVFELGAGTAIPSVRNFSHRAVMDRGARLVRINPSESAVASRLDVCIAAPALATLQEIESRLPV